MINSTTRNEYGELISNTDINQSGLGTVMSTDSGSIKIYTNDKKLLEDIKLMICTPLGSMLGFPEYGSNIYNFKYQGLMQSTYDAIQIELEDLLSKFSEIDVVSVSVGPTDTNDAIIIRYIIKYNQKELQDIVQLNII